MWDVQGGDQDPYALWPNRESPVFLCLSVCPAILLVTVETGQFVNLEGEKQINTNNLFSHVLNKSKRIKGLILGNIYHLLIPLEEY